jgi:hypothetical protein
MRHKSVDYWVCYHLFHSKRTKVFPRVAWPSLFKAGDVINWCQSMRDCSGVALPFLQMVGGTLQIGIRASISTLSLDGPKFKSRSIHGKCWHAGARSKFWHRTENIGMQECAVNCGTVRKIIMCGCTR